MKAPIYLSRLSLKRSSDVGPLISVLQPTGPSAQVEIDHKLVWSAMPQALQDAHGPGSNGGTPFLWRRDDAPGGYYVLGPAPSARSALFEVETKPFEANLAAGDRLEFVLRLNATVDRRTGGRNGKRERADVAMDLLRAVSGADRAAERQGRASKAAAEWLAARSAGAGFTLDALHLDGYRAMLFRGIARKPGRIGVFDLRGLLSVTQPEMFLARLAGGFGRAKAFGCGLMLIRRAR